MIEQHHNAFEWDKTVPRKLTLCIGDLDDWLKRVKVLSWKTLIGQIVNPPADVMSIQRFGTSIISRWICNYRVLICILELCASGGFIFASLVCLTQGTNLTRALYGQRSANMWSNNPAIYNRKVFTVPSKVLPTPACSKSPNLMRTLTMWLFQHNTCPILRKHWRSNTDRRLIEYEWSSSVPEQCSRTQYIDTTPQWQSMRDIDAINLRMQSVLLACKQLVRQPHNLLNY